MRRLDTDSIPDGGVYFGYFLQRRAAEQAQTMPYYTSR
jgi:hypothetical protein